MNKKTNLFVCVLAILSMNLQYDLAAYALDENDPVAIIDEASTEITRDDKVVNDAEPIEGTILTTTPLEDDQMQ